MPREVVLQLRGYEPWTWEDLQVIPDEEHHHYELIEGRSSGYRARNCGTTGVEHHWVIDPEVPSIWRCGWALRLGADGRYQDAGRPEGPQVLTLKDPFAVQLIAAELVED